jgi:hypothetical protein
LLVRPFVRSLAATIAASLLLYVGVRGYAAGGDLALDTLSVPAAYVADLPPGLTIPRDDPSIQDALRVVASDIDDDGDLDLVANEGSLEIAVWENDGAGHLTRKQPVQHDAGWSPRRPGPEWDPGTGSALTGVQSDPSTVGSGTTAESASLAATRKRSEELRRPATPFLDDSRSPRAPPPTA